MNNRNLSFWVLVIVVIAIVTLAGLLLVHYDSEQDRKEINLQDQISNEELRYINPKHRDANTFVFGFDLRASPQEDARQYIPFLKYLEGTTGYRFRLRFTPQNNTIVEELGRGVTQFAAVGAVTYIQGQAKYGIISLVRGLNAQGKAKYQSVIVVAPDSPIRKIEDLRGKRIAFGSITSTQGHLIPRIILAQHDLTLRDLASYEWVGSHQNCASAVISGRFDAGGIQDTMGRDLAKAGIVRIIHTSDYYPSSGIAANKDVPAEVLRKVKKALLDFDPKGKEAASFYHWDRTEMPNGFIEAHDKDYAELHDWARKFGLLEDTH